MANEENKGSPEGETVEAGVKDNPAFKKVELTPEEEQKEKAEAKKREGDLLVVMREYANRYNGYPYISVSRIKSYNDKDVKTQSILVQRMKLNFLLSGRGDAEQFGKIITGTPVAYVQAHAECPTLCEDGVYDGKNPLGKLIKTISVAEFILSNPDEFEPFILVKQGPDNFGIIKGSPFKTVTAAEAKVVRDMFDKGEKAEQPK